MCISLSIFRRVAPLSTNYPITARWQCNQPFATFRPHPHPHPSDRGYQPPRHTNRLSDSPTSAPINSHCVSRPDNAVAPPNDYRLSNVVCSQNREVVFFQTFIFLQSFGNRYVNYLYLCVSKVSSFVHRNSQTC